MIGFSLFLMDTEAPKETGDHKVAVNAVNINKMDKKGTISIAKFDHILKVCFKSDSRVLCLSVERSSRSHVSVACCRVPRSNKRW